MPWPALRRAFSFPLMDRQYTILIVDDEEGLRTVVRSVLEADGYFVVEASDGEAGLAAVREQRPDLVLCDIEMPRMDGFDVLRRFRETGAPAVPFVFLTGRAARTDMRKGMNLGADDFLTKPFTAEELRSAVVTRLQRRGQLEADTEQKIADLRESISTSVPHELRTPLTGILGFAQLLEEQKDKLTSLEISEAAGHILDSGKRLQRTLEQFWTFAELALLAGDPKQRETVAESVTGPHVLVRVLARGKAREHGRESDLQLHLSDHLTVRISTNHLTRLLEEVLDNAFKFSTQGSSVMISFRPEDASCVLRVEDQGRGMEKKEIDAIGGFMQFGRRRHEQQGLGLGLSIAHEITRLYSGQLTVESTPGKGTAVTVRLPAARES